MDPPSQDVPKRTLSWWVRFGSAITGRPKTNVAMVGPFWIRHHRKSQKGRCDGGPVLDPPSQDVPKRTLSWWARFGPGITGLSVLVPLSQGVPKRSLSWWARSGPAITGRPKTHAVMVGPSWARYHRPSQNARCHGGPVLGPLSQDVPKCTLSWWARAGPAIPERPQNARCHVGSVVDPL